LKRRLKKIFKFNQKIRKIENIEGFENQKELIKKSRSLAEQFLGKRGRRPNIVNELIESID